jgi:hypothetical protein
VVITRVAVYVDQEGLGSFTIRLAGRFLAMVDDALESSEMFDNELFKREVPDEFSTIVMGIAARKQDS